MGWPLSVGKRAQRYTLSPPPECDQTIQVSVHHFRFSKNTLVASPRLESIDQLALTAAMPSLSRVSSALAHPKALRVPPAPAECASLEHLFDRDSLEIRAGHCYAAPLTSCLRRPRCGRFSR